MKLILSYIRKYLGIFLLSTLFLTLEAAADLLQPAFMSVIVDQGIKNADINQILRLGTAMLGIALAGAVCAVIRNRFASFVSQTIGRELRHDMYHHVQQLSMENIDRLRPASIITRITNDVAQIQEFINGIMRIMVKAPIIGIGAIIMIMVQTPGQAGYGRDPSDRLCTGLGEYADWLSTVWDSAEKTRPIKWGDKRISFLCPCGKGIPCGGRGDGEI